MWLWLDERRTFVWIVPSFLRLFVVCGHRETYFRGERQGWLALFLSSTTTTTTTANHTTPHHKPHHQPHHQPQCMSTALSLSLSAAAARRPTTCGILSMSSLSVCLSPASLLCPSDGIVSISDQYDIRLPHRISAILPETPSVGHNHTPITRCRRSEAPSVPLACGCGTLLGWGFELVTATM